MSETQKQDVQRLEQLWSGDFGNAYVDRNAASTKGRGPFWSGLLGKIEVSRALEIGCNLGGNLEWIAKKVPPRDVYGIDINEKALATLRERVPGVNAMYAPAREVPFRDRWFDLVFTAGVLIHQPLVSLPLVMNEVVRCSRKYVLAMEYHADTLTEVPYRGHAGALFKQDYGKLYQELFPELRLVEKGFLPKDDSWDDVTWWLFSRT
jgi:pseudaminic acid biosynthesis-associated methylase